MARPGRKELAAAGLFVLAFAAVPLFRTELYPFSRAPMFADAPLRYCEYAVTDPDGRPLDLLPFGLQRNYWGNPIGAGVGFLPPPAVDVFGEVAPSDEVAERVRERLAAFRELPYVEVRQTVIGAVDDRRVGPVAEPTVLRLNNPHFRGPAR